jgi:hypothetical protein
MRTAMQAGNLAATDLDALRTRAVGREGPGCRVASCSRALWTFAGGLPGQCQDP